MEEIKKEYEKVSLKKIKEEFGHLNIWLGFLFELGLFKETFSELFADGDYFNRNLGDEAYSAGTYDLYNQYFELYLKHLSRPENCLNECPEQILREAIANFMALTQVIDHRLKIERKFRTMGYEAFLREQKRFENMVSLKDQQ